MKCYRMILLAAMLALCIAQGKAQTIEECWAAAEQNYPIIRQYGLVERTVKFSVENIAKSWLPQVAASAQATYQSAVTAWPDEMQTMLRQMGVEVKGLRKDQYRVGLDIQQTIYDGGSIRSQQEVARRQGDVETAQTAVSLYQVRQRVNEMYFGILLMDEHIRLGRDRVGVLLANEAKLEKLYNKGVAAESDWKSVRAERLSASQQLSDIESQRGTLAHMLGVFCGMEIKDISMPENPSSVSESAVRPELRLADARIALADAQERALDTALRPRFSLFASGYYGYPGYNMFEDMMRHRWTLNGMVGARLTWNISGLYTRKADKAKLAIQREQAETARDVFLFNNRLDKIKQDDDAARFNNLIKEDDEIIELRKSVRRAAESKLDHGIIDATDLVRDINQENAACVARSVHKIEMWKSIYDKKVTTNN